MLHNKTIQGNKLILLGAIHLVSIAQTSFRSAKHNYKTGMYNFDIHTHFLCHMHIFTYNWALLIFVWACISDVISLLSIFVWACISDVIFLFFLKNFWETAKQIIVKKLEKSQMSKFYGILQ